MGYNFKHPAQFPPSAVRDHHQGRVIVLVHVDANGVVTDVRVETSSGYRDLDKSALEAAKGWKYKPPYKNGVPQSYWVRMPVNFAFSK